MTTQVQDAARPRAAIPLALWLIAALTATRVLVLMLTPLNLHGDEAQYWAWSRALDWGYFSKPPLIAWTIAGTTSLFGNDEWAVRLFAPLAHGVAAVALFFLARKMYSERAAFWAGLSWALMPGVQLSCVIISTDALLLPLWALSLLCLWRLIETGKYSWAIGLGLSFGFGVLAKYAMAYFLIGAALACLMSARTRAALLSRAGALAAAIALICAAPNLIWNATHHFTTIANTAADAALGGAHFHPQELLQFLVDQFGVIGPLQFGALAFLLIDAARRRKALTETDRYLLAFVTPALAIIAVQALLSRANANWAAAAYPAAVVWIAGRFAQGRGEILLKASLALHAFIALLFAGALLSPPFADKIGAANSLKRAREWKTTAVLIAQHANALPQRPSAIMVDNRLLFYDLNYYWRGGAPAPLRMWVLEAKPGNSAETSAPMRAEDSAQVLIVMATPTFHKFVFQDFHAAQDLGKASIPLGGGKTRPLLFATASGFAPVPRDAAFEARVHPDRDD